MRITLVTAGDAGRDPGARSLAWSLTRVGHTVTTVHAGAGNLEWHGQVRRVPARVPEGLGPVGWIARRLQPTDLRRAGHGRRLAAAVADTQPDVVIPLNRRDLSIARAGRAPVLGDPAWDRDPGSDMAAMAPHDVRLSTSPAGPGLDHHLPRWQPSEPIPRDGRWAGMTVVVAYRQTETTPARYLTAAMERAGIEVVRVGTELDWDAIPASTRAVVVVESPLPPVRMSGTRKPIPVLFWVHHGEHHLGANLRLTDRYGADAVLLAHSWHLAHRFPVPVTRFPFGVPVELVPPDPTPFPDRRYDVAMVGVGLRAEAGRYGRRGQIVAEIDDRLGSRACFPDRVSPEELARIYGDSRIVVNEGGTKHFPITMRVFEATGAGALLLSEELPGMDVLLGRHRYVRLAEDVADQVEALVADPANAAIALEAHDHVMRLHTYDRRVDELVAVIQSTVRRPQAGNRTSPSGMAALFDADPDVDTVLVPTGSDLASLLPDRTVWETAALGDRSSTMRFDAVVVSEVGDSMGSIERAQRFVYATAPVADRVIAAACALHPAATVERTETGARIDLGFTGGYRAGASG